MCTMEARPVSPFSREPELTGTSRTAALIAANLNAKVIQARLGHATIAETMDTYGHLFPDSEDLGRGAVESALSSALAEQERNRGAR